MLLRRRYVMFAFLMALSACSGGGSSLPGIPASSRQPATAPQSVQLSILIPAMSAAANRLRRPAYISASTQSAVVSVNGGTGVILNLAANAPGCSGSAAGRTCTLSVAAPSGPDTFGIKLFQTTNGSGPVLSQGTASATIVTAQNNIVRLTLDGVVASVALTLANSPIATQGTKSTIGLTVNVKDAAGNIIVGPDPYSFPITLTDSDSTTTSISTTSLQSPADAANITVDYDGGALSPSATFSATGSGLNAGAVTTAALTPQVPNTTVTFNDYTTYGFDNQRTLFNPNSTAITPSTLPNLHIAWQTALGAPSSGDYNTQTQPVIATNIPGYTAVIFVGGSGSGKVYAYDALTGKAIWSRSLGVEQYTCAASQIPTNFGVGGTVAYDPSSRSLYVVGNRNSVNNGPAQNTLFHIDGASGTVLGQVDFAPNPIGPSELNFSHVSVTLAGSVAYVGTAATCDISSWRGRVVAINVPTMSIANTLFTVWNPTTNWGGGGVWGWGGVSIDTNGTVFTGVGNTDNGTTTRGTISAPFQVAPSEESGNGDSFMAISSDLATIYQTNHPIPNTIFGGQAADLDINGTPAIFKPSGVGCDTLAAVQGKSGSLYMYDTTNISAGPISQYQLSPPTYNDPFLGGPAYSPVTNRLYTPIPSSQGTLFPQGMMAIDPGCGSPSVAWHTQFGPDSVNNSDTTRSAPAVSAGGVVFVGTPCMPDGVGGCKGDISQTAIARSTSSSIRKPALCCGPPPSGLGGAVWALDAATGAILNSGMPLFTTPGTLRMPPTIDGNWVFVLDNAGDMYGLTLDPKYASIQAVSRQVDARSRTKWELEPTGSH